MHSGPSVCCFFRDTPPRRAAGSAAEENSRGLFAGTEFWHERGWHINHNLHKTPGRVAHQIGERLSRRLHAGGGWGGDFPSVFSHLKEISRADVVFSSVDSLGIPLALCRKWGLIRPPIVYVSIGLPERLAQMRGKGKNKVMQALSGVSQIICYGWEESVQLQNLLPDTPVTFIPYGVDTAQWPPRQVPETVDVLSPGVDPHRDFAQLIPFAEAHPEKRIKIIAPLAQVQPLGVLPENIIVSDLVPLSQFAQEMAAARVIALPVKENSYSAATTTLLQAMSMGKAVVVSETGAIREGYGLREADVCRRVSPGDARAFSEALMTLLENDVLREVVGQRAAGFVREHLEWNLLSERLAEQVAKFL